MPKLVHQITLHNIWWQIIEQCMKNFSYILLLIIYLNYQSIAMH